MIETMIGFTLGMLTTAFICLSELYDERQRVKRLREINSAYLNRAEAAERRCADWRRANKHLRRVIEHKNTRLGEVEAQLHTHLSDCDDDS